MGTNRETAASDVAVSHLRETAVAYRHAANQWRRLAPEAITPVAFAELSIACVHALESAAALVEKAAEEIERLSHGRSDHPPGDCATRDRV